MKFAIVVGHEAVSPGAKGVYPLDCYEYGYNKELAAMISCDLHEMQIDSQIFFRDKVGIHGVYQEVNQYVARGCVELHFNASGLFRVQGTETLYVPRVAGSASLASLVHQEILKALSRAKEQDRGLITPHIFDRGYANLTQALCPSILIEPFFGDNEQDAILGNNNKSDLAKAVAIGIQQFLAIGGLK